MAATVSNVYADRSVGRVNGDQSGVNLSRMISDTYPLARKCPPINGEKAIQLGENTPATVYFKTHGWVGGYLVKGDTVYYNPDTLSMTRMVRCGNPARGRVKPPAPEVVYRERVRVVQKPPKIIRETVYEAVTTPTPPPPVTVINNITMAAAQQTFASVPIGGNNGACANSTSMLGFSWVKQQNICIPINISNANSNVNGNTNVTNVGDGSASGKTTGTGSSTANSGTTTPHK